MKHTSIGHAAYEKWRALIPMPDHFPPWERLPLTAKTAWAEIAQAAVDQHVTEIAPNYDDGEF